MEVSTYSENAVLHDGSPVIVRAITPQDKSALQAAFAMLSPESAYSRFFRAKRTLSPRELEYFTELDFVNHVAIGVGLLQDDHARPIGIGRYIVTPSAPTTAEVAFTVDDNYQGRGVGSLLLSHLALIARERGIDQFCATMLVTNQDMWRVFARSKFPLRRSIDAGVIEVWIALR